MNDGLKNAHREAIIEVIAANGRVERAVLFGSRATGTNSVSSDVDIALFGDRLTLTDWVRLSAVIAQIPMAQSVDLLLYASISDRTLREHIRKHGVEWYPRATHQWRQGVYGRVPVKYVEESLESLCVPEHGIQTGPFGSQLHKRDYVSDGTPIVTVEHLGENRLVHRNLPRVSDKDRDRLSKYRLKAGDIVFSRVGSVDRRALVRQEEEGWLFSGRCLRVRGDPDQIDRTFLSYFFGLKAFREHIRSIAVGATMPSLNTRLLSNIVVPHPPLSEQHAIAQVLATLDDKIELNRRMNATLEAMAQALFKSWLIDFDPVRAKMEGRDTGLPKDIADLFPDRLVDSEMGEIPMGWTVRSLGDIATSVKRGVDPARVASDTPYIGLQHMPRGSVALTDWNGASSVSSRKFAFEVGDILFGKLRPYFHKVGIAPVGGVCSTDIEVLKARTPNWSAFVLACVSSPAFVAHTSQTSTGTKMPRTSWQAMSTFEVCWPSEEIAQVFQQVMSPMLGRIVGNVHESRTLAALRDSLLPKLILGEVRLECAERAVESVA